MILQQTPLYKECLDAGGRMVPFSGWEMPVQFKSVIEEHQAVREHVGMFDISHMGVISIEGVNSKKALQRLLPTDIERIGAGEACYTVLLNERAGIIDDLIVYDLGPNNESKECILIICNAACFEKDFKWIKQNLDHEELRIISTSNILIALQGKDSTAILETLGGESLAGLRPFKHRNIHFSSINETDSTFVSHTGYTGEVGYELLLKKESGKRLWLKLLKQGVIPCGLGSRDTLRLEAGMHLYGNEMDSTTTPFEAGLGWLVSLEMQSDFIGRKALEKQAERGIKQKLIGLEMEGKAIARHGYTIFHEEVMVGKITSGTWSPTLKKAIAMGYISKDLAYIGNKVEVQVRGKKHPAKLVKRPFYKHQESK